MTAPARAEHSRVPARIPPPPLREPGGARDQLAYLKLRSQLLVDAPRVRTIGVLSAHAERRRTHAAFQVARCLGQGRERTVLLVDADFKRRTLTRQIAHRRAGEAEEVCGRAYRVHRNVAEGVDALTLPDQPRVMRPHDPLLWRDTLDDLAARYGYVVVDCPPVLDQPDAFVVRDVVDALVVVAIAGTTRLADLARAVDRRADGVLAVLLHGA